MKRSAIARFGKSPLREIITIKSLSTHAYYSCSSALSANRSGPYWQRLRDGPARHAQALHLHRIRVGRNRDAVCHSGVGECRRLCGPASWAIGGQVSTSLTCVESDQTSHKILPGAERTAAAPRTAALPSRRPSPPTVWPHTRARTPGAARRGNRRLPLHRCSGGRDG
jgi:hypothetical protein